MKPKEDFTLVDEIKAGNTKSFDELINRYKKKIYLTAYRLLGNHDDAEDITQEVIIKLYKNIDTFRKDSSVFTWLYKITTNLSLNELNRKKIKRFFNLDEVFNIYSENIEDMPEEKIILNETSEKIQKAIDKLPDKQKVVFTLRYFDGLSYEEINKIVGTSIGALKANYFHALQKVTKELKNELQ